MRHRDALRSLSMNPSNLLVAGACLRQQTLDFLPGPVIGCEACRRRGYEACLAWPPAATHLLAAVLGPRGLGSSLVALCSEARGWWWC